MMRLRLQVTPVGKADVGSETGVDGFGVGEQRGPALPRRCRWWRQPGLGPRRETAGQQQRTDGQQPRVSHDERGRDHHDRHPWRRPHTPPCAQHRRHGDDHRRPVAHGNLPAPLVDRAGEATAIVPTEYDNERGNQIRRTVVGRGMRNHLIGAATVLTAVTAITVGLAGPALACGGLVGENGTIQLERTTTLAAYHNGLEHYVTSFEFSGTGARVGSIVPLPGIPTSVERGGDWTLQRLEREVQPPQRFASTAAAGAPAAADSAQVLLQTRIDALDITILKGGGTEVGKWATDHGFLLTPDAPAVLDYYSRRSPVFMAARFDAAAARERGQNAGDGTPIHLTIPLDRPWVPLHILALGRDATSIVKADVFLLTDHQPQLFEADRGVNVARSTPASSQLLDDLRSDKGMDWVPAAQWLTYLKIDTPAGQLTHDLAASTTPGRLPSAVDAGISTNALLNGLSIAADRDWPFVVAIGTAAIVILSAIAVSQLNWRRHLEVR